MDDSERHEMEHDRLNENSDDQDSESSLGHDLTRSQAWCLYCSHFLSMWNSRAYEYGAVLFTQAVFPGDLLPSSLYGIAETICVLLSSSALGRWVDDSPSRLRPLLISIFTNRITIVICCITWLFALSMDDGTFQKLTFGLLLLLGMVVKMSRMSNMLSMERDWIPTVASYPLTNRPNRITSPYDLTHLNTVIRRIDIACKFLSPVVVSGAIALIGTKRTATMLAFKSLLSVAIEALSVQFVWKTNDRLKAEKPGARHQIHKHHSVQGSQSILAKCMRFVVRVERIMRSQVEGMRYYFSTNVWLPSIGVAVLHASVLDWAGTLITWLLNAGFSYEEVTLAKAVGSVFEIGSTFIFPLLVEYFRKRSPAGPVPGAYQMLPTNANDDDEEAETKDNEGNSILQDAGSFSPDRIASSLEPIVRAGHIGIFELFACLCPAVLALFFLDAAIEPEDTSTPNDAGKHEAFAKSPVMAIAFFAFISLSFLGRWIYDLSVTQLTQVLVPASHRSEFGGAEMAMIAGISLLHWIAAAIWHDQKDYKWLSVGSVCAVAAATALWYVWRSRWDKGLVVSGSRSG